MQILEAQVVSNVDYSNNGALLVYSKGVSEDPFYVRYTSPYADPYKGGFFALPEEGSLILITKPSNTSNWYFLSCIHSELGQNEPGKRRIDFLNVGQIPKEIYKTRPGKPQQVLIKDSKGNYIKLSSSYANNEFNTKAELASSLGKELILSDSPNMDTVILKNEFGDMVKITSAACGMSAARAIDIDAKGPVNLVSRESELDILVVDGRDINIENTSTGYNSAPWSLVDQQKSPYGSVNLKSKWRDLNFTTEYVDGKIFIRTKGASSILQLNSDGTIIIHSAKSISIESKESIDIKAAQNLNLEGTSVNIKGVTIKASGQSSTLNMDVNAAIQGVRVDLNPLTPLTPADPANPYPTEVNTYGD